MNNNNSDKFNCSLQFEKESRKSKKRLKKRNLWHDGKRMRASRKNMNKFYKVGDIVWVKWDNHKMGKNKNNVAIIEDVYYFNPKYDYSVRFNNEYICWRICYCHIKKLVKRNG
jgi:hypothetical protein